MPALFQTFTYTLVSRSTKSPWNQIREIEPAGFGTGAQLRELGLRVLLREK